jgi:hypothetical protein
MAARLGGRTEKRAHPDLPAPSSFRLSGATQEVVDGRTSRRSPHKVGKLFSFR